MVQDWLLNLPVPLMALIVFGSTYLGTAAIWLVVTRLAVDDRARAFKALSPGMLPPLGIIFGLLVGFTAAQVWRFREGQGCGCHRSERAAFGRSLVANVPQRAGSAAARSYRRARRHRGQSRMAGNGAAARLPHGDTGEIGRSAQHHLVFNPGGRQTEIGAARNHAIDRDCIGRTASAHHHQPVDRGSDQMGRAIASGALYPDRHFLGAQRQPRHL